MSAKEKLERLGLELNKPASPAANYVPVKKSGNNIYISGQISADENGVITGTLGKNMEIKAGQEAAATCALAILSHIVHSAGIELDEIISVVKLTVLVSSTSSFNNHHLVANGASDLLVQILGENGVHARAAFGVTALPLGAAVEIEAIIEV
jgi:enamine deaminase RidA (YjgF/YER057c/UK114 family)